MLDKSFKHKLDEGSFCCFADPVPSKAAVSHLVHFIPYTNSLNDVSQTVAISKLRIWITMQAYSF
jgi:hypothetical protein